MAGSAVLLAAAALALLAAPGLAGCPFSSSRNRRAAVEVAPVRGCTSDQWMGQIPMASDDKDALVRANDMFHQLYDSCGQQLRPQTVVALEGDYLVLLRNASRVAVNATIPPIYHNLKMVAHMPFAMFVMLYPHASAPNQHPFPAQALNAYIASAEAAVPTINAQRFPNNTQLVRNQFLVARVMDFARKVQNAQAVTEDELSQFFRAHKIELLKNVNEAARSQIDLTLKVINEWRDNLLSPDEWQGFRFIISSSHMAANDSVATQLFAHVLSKDPNHPDLQPNEYNERMIMLDDAVVTEDIALRLLGTHFTDYSASGVFFGDKYRLHRDLLSDAAKAYLDEIFS